MARILVGERVGKQGRMAVGCSASVFDTAKQKMLLTRRADNGQWCVPGGYMEAGESMTEACAREVLEETGLSVQVKRLVGVYTTPNWLFEYDDGNKWQIVVLHFEAECVNGELTTSSETTGFGFFSLDEARNLEMIELDRRRVIDGFARRPDAIICDHFELPISSIK